MMEKQLNIDSPKWPDGPEIIGETDVKLSRTILDDQATELIESLEKCSKDRKLFRRKICNYLRDNKSYLKTGWNDGWIIRKIDGRYLGDLTDASLIHYANLIWRRKQWKLTK